MKLTKGKIFKLYNKKKQTVKHLSHKKKKSYKRISFRHNRKVNLASQTIKHRHIGGNIPTPQFSFDESLSPKQIPNNSPLISSHSELSMTPSDETTTSSEEHLSPLQTPFESTSREEPQSPVKPNIIEEPISPVKPPINVEPISPPNETTLNVEPISPKEEPIIDLSNDTNSNAVSLDKLSELVASKITNTNAPQNGFTSVNQAISTMSTGGKRKFRITRKKR